MMPGTKVTSSHMVAVPSEVRRKMGLRPGDVLEWFDYHGWLLVRPRRRAVRKPFSDLILTEGVDTEGRTDEEILYGGGRP